MIDVDRDREVEQLRAQVAALEQLQEAHERAVLEQTARLDESMRQLQVRAAQLANSEDALREHTRILQSVLSSMADGVVVADAQGKFLLFNPAAERMLRLGPTDTPPEQWSERYGCYLPDSVTPYPSHDLPLARAIRGEEVNGAEIFIRHDLLPEGVWLSINARPLRDETGALRGGVVVMHDITDRVRANRRRAIESAVTRVLAESATLDEATPQLLRAIGEGLGADAGAVWNIDPQAGLLSCMGFWHRPGRPCEVFEAMKRAMAFAPGVGLPGRIWASRQPAWIADISRDDNLPSAPAAICNGLRSALGFPLLLSSGEVSGVVEFFNREALQPDEELLSLFASLGAQIGQFIERKRAEEELRRSRERFELAVRGSGDGVWDWDIESNEVYLSPRWKSMLGYEDHEVPNAFGEWEARIHPDDLERARETLRTYLNDPAAPPYELEHRLRHKDGSYRWILARAVALRDDRGRPLRMAGSHTDITHRKEMEEALRDSEALYHSLVETLPLNIFRKDLEGRFTFGNRLFCQTLGLTREQLVGKTDYDFYPRELADKYREDDCRVMATRQLFETVEEHVDPGGEKLYVQVLKTPVYDARGEVVGTQCIFWDVTDKKRADDAMRQAREAAEAASRAKSEFLANMSHEIRTPLNGIIGMTELVLDTPLSAEQREYLEMASKSADALMTVINDILDFSKIEAGKLDLDRQPFNLHDHLGDTLKTLAVRAHEKGLELACAIAPDVPETIVSDPGRLRQVIVNLVGNAIKFTDRGEVVVRVETVARRGQEAALQFSVTDTGIGIPPSKQRMIFDPFAQADGSSTRKYGGTGLGLSISARLVEMMGGQLAVESTPGRGSRFYFTAWFEVAETVPARRINPEQVRGLPVLVVDDNATNRRILEEILAHWGMQPTVAASGEEALAAVESAHAAGKPFALVLLDAQMPGMDGFDLAERLKNRPEPVGACVMMLSSAGQPANAARRRALGITACLNKPIKSADLWEAIREALGSIEERASRSEERKVKSAILDPRSLILAGRPSPRRLRILLAEDNVFNQKLAVGLLQKEGHSVVVAANGREALAALDRERFDLVLMDVQMPEMDGLEATAALRQREAETGRRTPVLAMTAYAMKGDRERCLAAGMDGYVSKPIRARDLFDAITALVPSPAPSPADLPPGQGPDWEQALKRVGGDRQLLREAVQIFLSECPGWLQKMRQGAAAGDPARMGSAAHDLKGCLGTFAARAAHDAAQRVLEMSRAGDLQGAAEACRAVEEAVEQLRPALTAFVEAE